MRTRIVLRGLKSVNARRIQVIWLVMKELKENVGRVAMFALLRIIMVFVMN